MRARSPFLLTLALCAAAPIARAHTPPPRYPRLRPPVEATSWLALAGGARSDGDVTRGVFDLRAGGSVTFNIGREGDHRLGPFVEASTATFASVAAVSGVEFSFGALPRPLRMFYYPGEGALSVRVGAGWTWRDAQPGAASTPIASLTLAYGYRAPFSLREYSSEWSREPDTRDAARYMLGARLWVNTTVDLAAPHAWQVIGGVEFEPVGAFRYLFGLY